LNYHKIICYLWIKNLIKIWMLARYKSSKESSIKRFKEEISNDLRITTLKHFLYSLYLLTKFLYLIQSNACFWKQEKDLSFKMHLPDVFCWHFLYIAWATEYAVFLSNVIKKKIADWSLTNDKGMRIIFRSNLPW
jgi:hypothetical protein